MVVSVEDQPGRGNAAPLPFKKNRVPDEIRRHEIWSQQEDRNQASPYLRKKAYQGEDAGQEGWKVSGSAADTTTAGSGTRRRPAARVSFPGGAGDGAGEKVSGSRAGFSTDFKNRAADDDQRGRKCAKDSAQRSFTDGIEREIWQT